jgi:hypothetical protein
VIESWSIVRFQIARVTAMGRVPPLRDGQSGRLL